MNILKFHPHQNIKISNPLSLKEIGSANTIKNINGMFELMKQSNGVGLAAPQIGWHKRVIVYGVDPSKSIRKKLALIPETIMINPVITDKSNDIVSDYEGNLSVENVVGLIDRSNEIIIKYISSNGEVLTKHVFGFEARIVQHEIDQLDGILFTQKSKKLITMSEYLKIIES
ncbi:MAG TPA: peptide deformylase [Holosporales bacterium]|nr:peptide deformylase [Holosporales bacterium]